MKPRKKTAIIYALSVLVAVICAVVLIRNRHNPGQLRGQHPDRVNDSPASGKASSQISHSTNRPGLGTSAPSRDIHAAVDAKNVPVEFWGKVVDQEDSPIQGVRAKARIRHWGMARLANPDASFFQKEATTGVDGLLHISGDNGDVLTLESLEKDGYEPEQGALRSFGYNTSQKVTSNPDHPVVLRMWKTGTKQALVSADKAFELIPDGRTYTIDLLKGASSQSAEAEGDIRVWVKRPREVALGQKYDWSCEIQAVNGGLLDEPDVYASMSIAPEDGYNPQYDYGKKEIDRPWSDGIGNKRFYIKSRGGKVYGRVTIDLYAYYNSKAPARVRINYALNPTGSRYLN